MKFTTGCTISNAMQKDSSQPPIPLRFRSSGSEIGIAWDASLEEETVGAGAGAAAIAPIEGVDEDDGLSAVTSFWPQLMQNLASSELPTPHFMQYIRLSVCLIAVPKRSSNAPS